MAEPQLIVSGPRKRKETRRVTDNADPLLKNKKARLAPEAAIHAPGNDVSKANTKKSISKAVRRHQSAEIEEVDDEACDTQHVSPKNPNHVIELADGSDDEESDGTPVVNDNDGEESEHEENAEEELRESNEVELTLFSCRKT